MPQRSSSEPSHEELLTIDLQSSLFRQCVIVFRTRKPNAKEDDDDIFERLFYYYPSSVVVGGGGMAASGDGGDASEQHDPVNGGGSVEPPRQTPKAEEFAISNIASKVEGWLTMLESTMKSAEPAKGVLNDKSLDPMAATEARIKHNQFQQNSVSFHNHCIVVDSTMQARVAVCKRDRLVFALCCKRVVPRKIMRDHILKLANVYELYNGPVADIYTTKCGGDEDRFEAYVRSTAPELRTIASQMILHPNRAFSPLQYTEVPPRSHTLFVGASQLLDSCTQCVDYFGGCIMCDQSILCNQLDSELLQWVLHRNKTMRANSTHFPSSDGDQHSGDSDFNDNHLVADEELADDTSLREILDPQQRDEATDSGLLNPPSPTDSINSAHNTDGGLGVISSTTGLDSEQTRGTSLFHIDEDEDDDETDFAAYGATGDDDHSHHFNNDDPLIEEENPDDDAYTQRLFLRKRSERHVDGNSFTPVTVERLRAYLSPSLVSGETKADPASTSPQSTTSAQLTQIAPYHHREHILLTPQGNKLDLSHIFLNSQILKELYHNTHSYYDLKRALSAQRVPIAAENAGVYMVLVIIQSERLSIASIYRKDFVLSEEFITKVLEPVTEELNILESKLEQLNDIMEDANVHINDYTVILSPTTGRLNSNTNPNADGAFSSTANRSTLLFDRFNHKMRASLMIRHYDSFIRSIVPIRESLLKDHASKIILKKHDELVFGKVMFNSEVYEQFKLDSKNDLPLEKAEGLVRKHTREDFKINLI